MQTPLFTAATLPTATRAEGLRRLEDFVPRAGRQYAAERNFDRGPQRRSNVSTLSPFIRYRAVSESDVLAAVLERHSLAGAEKFVQEVFWRTYWKGWLEAHPQAWSRYLQTLAARIACIASESDLRRHCAAAMAGQTGIDAFDAWARELVAENYLHNHARMWFASIWIFTLGLPWELGADFFMRNLLDGDPAANTLSWRWVAGLHTRGKTYTATRDNIARYTENRFAPQRPLARSTVALTDEPLALHGLPDVPVTSAPSSEPSLLILHEDDLCGDAVEAQAAVPGAIRGVCALRAAHRRSPQAMNPAVIAFSDALCADAVARSAERLQTTGFGLLAATSSAALPAEVASIASECGATRIVVPFAPIGAVRPILDELAGSIRAAGFTYAEFGRRYDAVCWPAATRGFFGLRSRIPSILAELGIGAR